MADDAAVPTPVVQLDAPKHPYVSAQRLDTPRSYSPPRIGEQLSRINYELFHPVDRKRLALEVVSRIVIARSISGTAATDSDLVALVTDAIQFAKGKGEFYTLDGVYVQDGKVYGVARALKGSRRKSVKIKKESPTPIVAPSSHSVLQTEISVPDISYVVEVGKNKWFCASLRSSPRQRTEHGRVVYDLFDPSNERVPYISPIDQQRTVTSTTIDDLLRQVKRSAHAIRDEPPNKQLRIYVYIHDVHATAHKPPRVSAKYTPLSRKR